MDTTDNLGVSVNKKKYIIKTAKILWNASFRFCPTTYTHIHTHTYTYFFSMSF